MWLPPQRVYKHHDSIEKKHYKQDSYSFFYKHVSLIITENKTWNKKWGWWCTGMWIVCDVRCDHTKIVSFFLPLYDTFMPLVDYVPGTLIGSWIIISDCCHIIQWPKCHQSEILIHIQDSHAILLTEFPPLASLFCGGNSRLVKNHNFSFTEK